MHSELDAFVVEKVSTLPTVTDHAAVLQYVYQR